MSGRRDPDRVVASLIGTGDGWRAKHDTCHVGVEALCRAPKAHRVASVVSYTGSEQAAEVTWKLDDGRASHRACTVDRPHTWARPHDAVRRAAELLRLEHRCAQRVVLLRVDLDRIRGEIAEMWDVRRVELRRSCGRPLDQPRTAYRPTLQPRAGTPHRSAGAGSRCPEASCAPP